MFQMVYRIGDPLEAVLCRLHQLGAEIQRASVMGAQHEKAEYLQIILFTDFPDSTEITKGFGHLLIVNI